MILKMEHIGIFVSDIEKALLFYTDVFGFEILHRGENNNKAMAFLVHPGDTKMELELIEDYDVMKKYEEIGKVNHLAFTVADMDIAVKKLKDKELDFINEPGINPITGAKSVFFWGPDREMLQLIEPAKK